MREYEIKIEVDGEIVPITVKTDPDRVKNIGMLFDGESFIITAPLHVTEEDVRQFAKQHIRWIKNRYKPSGKRRGNIKDTVTYLGKDYHLIVSNGSPSVVISDDVIMVFAPDGDREKAKAIFIEFWKEKALTYFTAKTEHFYKLYGRFLRVPCMPKIEIVKVNGYWGQCNWSKRLIKYNLYALQFDEKYCDYIVCHELTHFRHHDHSVNFHAALNKVFPNEKEVAKRKKERNTKMWFDL